MFPLTDYIVSNHLWLAIAVCAVAPFIVEGML